MNSRERVLRALNFESPDRAPRFLSALPWVELFAKDDWELLCRDYPGDFESPAGGLAPGERRRGTESRKGTYIDDWGVRWEVYEDGVVGEVKEPIIAKWSALDGYKLPWEQIKNADWDSINRFQEENLAGEQKFMLAWPGVRLFERIQFLRGTENTFMDMAYGSSEFFRLRDMVHEFNVKVLEAATKTNIDGLMFMDDWGSQTSLLISPAMWREYFKPCYKDYCDIIHSTGKKVFMHSDGEISSIYEDLIEVGIDALNSQLFCMDIEGLAKNYKGRLTFWGEIDRQWILPFGTVADVRRAVARVRRALDDGSGGVIAMCEWGPHNPPENIRAVYEAWMEPLRELISETDS